MRVLTVFLATLAIATPAFAEKPQPELKVTYEADTYRFAEVYRSERGTTVEDCAMMCSRDQACAAWSLTPATFRIGPRCELKSAPGAASHRPGASSGMSEFWQMDAGRHADMRYQPRLPASRQPAAVPLEQLRPSPVPRVFGDPPPVRQPELMGGPQPRVSAVMRRPEELAGAPKQIIVAPTQTPAATQPVELASMPAPETPLPPTPTPKPAPVKIAVAPVPAAPAPKQPVQVLRGPGRGETPEYVKQPAPETPHPLYGTPPRVAEPPKARMVFKDPSRDNAALSTTADYNAVLRRERQTLDAQPAKATAQPLPARAPWTERDGTDPDYSVGGSDFIPGDEDATAGYVDGVPEAGS